MKKLFLIIIFLAGLLVYCKKENCKECELRTLFLYFNEFGEREPKFTIEKIILCNDEKNLVDSIGMILNYEDSIVVKILKCPE